MKIQSKTILILCFVLVALLTAFQLIFLNYPKLNGDEALFGIMAISEWQKMRHGDFFHYEQFVSYVGPVDLWLLALFRGLIQPFQFFSDAWTLRIFPLLTYWTGVGFLFFELRRHNKKVAPLFLLLILSSPLFWVHTRIIWSSSYIPGLVSLLFAEVLRARRLEMPRYPLLALWAALAFQCHPAAAFGIGALFLCEWGVLFRGLRKRPFWAALGVAVFVFVAFPVLRAFPPPVDGGAEARGHSIFTETRDFLNALIGNRSLRLAFGVDLAGGTLRALMILGSLFLVGRRWVVLARSRVSEWDQRMGRYSVITVAFSVLLLIFLLNGRSLKFFGCERYILSMAILWMVLFADAFLNFVEAHQIRSWVVSMFLLGTVAFEGSRISIPLIQSANAGDPYARATEWMHSACPADRCVVQTSSFWNYWPMRFFSSDQLKINPPPGIWKTGVVHPTEKLELAGCWELDQKQDSVLDWRDRREFPVTPHQVGQVCYVGIRKKGER